MRIPSHSCRRGVAAVELALLLPFLLALILGIWEIGRLTEAQQLMSNAAREGGRRASTGVTSAADIQAAVMTYLTKAGIPTANATITVENLTAKGADPTAAAQFDELKVTITVPVKDLRWMASSTFVSGSSRLTAEAVWCSLKNREYPSPVDPPVDY